MARKFPIRHPNKPSSAKLPPRTLKGGSTTPRRTGMGAKGMGLGYHGHPRGATTPATGGGYHGHPPHPHDAANKGPTGSHTMQQTSSSGHMPPPAKGKKAR